MNSKNLVPYAVLLIVGAVGGYLIGHQPQQKDEMTGSSAAPMHMEGVYDVPATSAKPTVALAVTPDTMSGWNLHISTTHFSFDPANAGGDAMDGHGHAHVFVDGTKVGRAYGDWYYLSALKPGEHTIKVELVTNDHKVYTVDGTAVATSTVVVQADPNAPAAAAKTFELSVKNGKVVSGNGDIEVMQGDTVKLSVTNDADNELHLHGYNLMTDLKAGQAGTLTFVASASGRFPFELENTKQDIGAISVMPR